MKQVCGWWLPDGEQYMAAFLEGTAHRVNGRTTYQWNKMQTALDCVKRRNYAIDVGAHVGLWAWFLAREFRLVMAIEPLPENFECLVANCAGVDAVRPRRCALGAADGTVSMKIKPGSSADSEVCEGADVQMYALDGVGDIGSPDFIKLDCVGAELPALQGMERILTEARPVVCVEQKPGYPERFGLPPLGAVEYLQDLGATLRHNMSGVYVLSFD
jgi:FkbM family methyltransferase